MTGERSQASVPARPGSARSGESARSGTSVGSRVAWVTGASRGVGRGVAIALGQAGWTVYATARSTTGKRTSHLPGTVEETASAVTAAGASGTGGSGAGGPAAGGRGAGGSGAGARSTGGRGIGIVCDHRDDAAVASVAARIQAEHGRLDLLVNNAWGGYERLNAGGYDEWIARFWQQPVGLFDSMFTGGVRTHYVALAACAPLLISTPGSLSVLISVGIQDSELERTGVAYAAAKAADDEIARAAAAQFREHGVTSVALYPDWVRTEGVMQFADQVNLTNSQSPEGVGRAVAALAADADRFSLTGRAIRVTDLAARYGIEVSS